MKELGSQALNGSETTIGKQLSTLDDRIEVFEDRLVRIEGRYWKHFTVLETAMNKANNQSSWLMSQLGGGAINL